MPNPFGQPTPGGSSKYRAPSITSTKKQTVTGTKAGVISVNVSDPATTLAASAQSMAQGAVGLGKGLVSIVENLPVIGGIAEPVIGAIGGVADATIGRVVSAAEKTPIIKDIGGGALSIAGNVLTGALDIVSMPGRFTEQRVAAARIQSGVESKNDLITTLFGKAPADAVTAVRNGTSIEDAALQLANSNAGFSENGAINFLHSLILDPLNVISFGAGKFASIGAEASQLSKIGVSGLRELATKATKSGLTEAATGYARQADFLEKWGLVGDVYNQTLGKLDKFKRSFASNIAKESAVGYTRVYQRGLGAIDNLLNGITASAGREVADRGLKNVATTFANAIKSGSVRARAAIVRSNAQDFSDNVITHFIKNGRDMDLAQLLAQEVPSGGTLGDLLKRLDVADENIAPAIEYIKDAVTRGVRGDDIRRNPAVAELRDTIERLSANERIKSQKDLILATARYRADGNASLASEDAFRLLSEAKLDRVPAANDATRGIRELKEDLVAGFGISDDAAEALAKDIFAQNSGDVRTLTDVLAFARDAAYGQAVRELAATRKLFDTGDFLSRITITSRRSLTDARAKELNAEVDALQKVAKGADEAAAAQAKARLNQISDELVSQYDEFGVFAGSDYTRDQVFDFLKKAKDITVRELSGTERADIASRAKQPAVRQLRELERRLEQYGYRLGISPEEKISTVRTMIVDHHGRERFDDLLMPFSDTLDHVAIKGLDDALVTEKLRPSKLSRVWDKFTRPYGAEVTKNNVAERFVSSMVKKTGISVNTARRLMSRVTDLAAEKGVQPRALFMDNDEVIKIFRQEMGDLYGRLDEAGTTPIQEIISAAAGDWAVSGLTTGFTGRVKAIFPEITQLTDRFYPEIRFGRLNPFFNLVLERIETRLMLAVHGVRKEVADEAIGDIRGTVLRKAHLSPLNVNREINDGFLKMQNRAAVNVATAVEASPSFKNRVANIIRPLWKKETYSIQGVKDAKEVARNIMTDQFAAREFISLLEEVAPGKLSKLAEHYGVTNADQAIELLLADYLIQADPVQFAKYIKSQSGFARSLSAKALRDGGIPAKEAEDIAAATIAAFEIAIQRASRAADKSQYFASHRSWLERSLNHPFLGLYPYSYMTQKAIPSLLRVMFAPRFGDTIMPGVGYASWEKLTEYVDNQVNTDQNLISQIIQDDALLYLFTTLSPLSPDRSGFSMPAWLRRGIIEPGLKGENIGLPQIGQTLTEVGATVVRGTVLGQTRTVLEGITGIEDAIKSKERISGFLQDQSEFLQEKVLELRGQ